MRKLEWTHVALVGIFMVILGGLSYLGKDGMVVLTGVIAVLGALGFGFMMNKQAEIQEKQGEISQSATIIKEQTNGRISQLMATIERQNEQHRRDMKEMADKMAMMGPLPLEPPVSGVGGEGNPSNL